MGHGQIVGVQDATSAIFLGVHQYNNVFIGDSCQPVVHVLQVQRGQVAVGVERVEVGMQGGVPPDAPARLADAAVLRRSLHGNDTETVAHRAEGLMGKHGVDGCLHILHEHRHLVLLIAFGQEGDADAACCVGRLHYYLIGSALLIAHVADQDVRGHHLVSERRHHFAAVVVEFYGDLHGVAWHGHKEHVLERLPRLQGLGVGEPLLEQRREGVAVDQFARPSCHHFYLPVALHGHLSQPLALAIPSWHHVQLVDGDALFVGITSEVVIDT